jgi:endonuclease-3
MANQKSARIKDILTKVKSRYGGYDLSSLRRMSNEQVIEELTHLDGVGLKTASCVLLFSLGRDVFPVDTHVHRLCGRLNLAPGCTTPEKTFRFMQHVYPKGRGYSFHTNLIRFGRRVCRTNNPRCDICPLYRECTFPGRKKRLQRNSATTRTDHNFMLLDSVQEGR